MSLPSETTGSFGHCTEPPFDAGSHPLCPLVPWPRDGGGGPQANLSRLLKGCDIEDLSKAQARAVGALAARANHDDIVDVSVVEGAVRRSHAVVTRNASHIRKVASAAGVSLTVHSV